MLFAGRTQIEAAGMTIPSLFFHPFFFQFVSFPRHPSAFRTLSPHSSMKTESKPPSPRHELDKHAPAEIWEQIFSYLYPSQLCRLSMVNKTFETIVSSLPIWRYLFTENTVRKRLRFLRGIPESKSYML